MRLLVCEDDFLILMNTAEMLRELGHEVEEAADGRSALAALADDAFDVLLTDVGLPDMNGVELAHRVRATTPDLPIIFASGLGDVEGFGDDASVAFVQKPYTMPALEMALAAVTRR
ncbi:Response regulator receiver domain-containing protein [Kaistia soli DSM 19436]|uniref:Response regulator receiver domain-containing protein n=1 Tax=Kaistia soli DSM 19436 TaxID=1122133 RepID=A0A1M5INZ2_9HYPH|nr:response regulator [Kaistia soli]SHG29769.1 Response regulator receiver domain-containing protein [Kaistia soli DSM 19436]